MWVGSICASKDDAAHLISLGIIIGEYDEENREFINCQVSNEALDKLDPFIYMFSLI